MISDWFWKALYFQLKACKHSPLVPLPFAWNHTDKHLIVRNQRKRLQSCALTILAVVVQLNWVFTCLSNYKLVIFTSQQEAGLETDEERNHKHNAVLVSTFITICFSAMYTPIFVFATFFTFHPSIVKLMFNSAIHEYHIS